MSFCLCSASLVWFKNRKPMHKIIMGRVANINNSSHFLHESSCSECKAPSTSLAMLAAVRPSQDQKYKCELVLQLIWCQRLCCISTFQKEAYFATIDAFIFPWRYRPPKIIFTEEWRAHDSWHDSSKCSWIIRRSCTIALQNEWSRWSNIAP